MKIFYRIARTIIYPFFRWLLPVNIIGTENIPNNGPYILCANHTSMSDPFFLVSVFPSQIHFMAKAELFKVKIVGAVLHAMGAFAVNRGKGDIGAINTAENLIKSNKILGIFPEGTRYKTGAPRRAKSGVAYITMDTNADILPVSIYREGAFNIFRKTTIRVGKLIKYQQLIDVNETERGNMKRIVNTVTNTLTELWEMKH